MKRIVATAIASMIACALAIGARSAEAAPDRLDIDTVGAYVGDSVTVSLVASDVAPGLGVWTVVVNYDSSVVELVACESENSVCIPKSSPGLTRIAGATANELDTVATLAALTFRCNTEGNSPLVLEAEVWDGELGNPAPKRRPDILSGSVGCFEQPAAPGSVSIESGSAVVGGQATIALRAEDLPQPGPGEWKIQIDYDAQLLSVADMNLPECERTGAQCTATNLGPVDPRIEVEGVSSGDGLPADATLATIAFRCVQPGVSSLSVTVVTWSREAGPMIEQPATQSGSFQCTEAEPPSLPSSGTGSSREGNQLALVSAVLTAIGASFVALAALRKDRA